ncbi:MAG: tetratricopeptide repeat protein, partial [Gemmatimonadetes bacterium]|nr:tetratricopeptide repeat protein [Gemmatimonadota bacterium]
KRDVRDLQAEMRSLAMRQDSAVLALQATNRSLRDSLSVLSEFLFEMRGENNNQIIAVQDQLLRIGELVGQSQRSVAGLRDQIEQQRRQQLPAPPPTTRPDSAEQDESVVPGAGAPARGDAEEMYNAANTQFNRGSYSVARGAFQQFLSQFPNHALAPSAHIRLGEILAQENRLEEAAIEYLKVRERFPNDPEVPNALYRAGAAYLEMENFDLARRYLEIVVNSYGDHAMAELAQERLNDIP